MDFYSLKRKELQALCKKHGIPANKTNLEMAECLTASLKVNGNATSEEGNEKNSKDAVNKFKKVRFSRDNETREYEPSANPKPRWSRRKTTLANPVSKESGHNNLSKEVVRKKRGRGSEKVESDCRITRSRAKVDSETFSVLQKSTASQKGEESKNTARDSVEARNGFRRSIRNMAKGTDSELMKVDVVSTITSSGAQFEGNASTIEGKGENEVVGVMKECEGVIQIKESSKGLGRNGCRRKSVAHLSDQVESYSQQVLKEAGKRSKNLDFEVANEVKASLDSREHMEKASITAAGPRRSRRKAAVLSSTAATSEQGAREAVGKVKQSKENVSGEDAKVSNELRRSTRNASRQSSVATCNEMNEIVDVVSTIASSGAQFAGNASTIEGKGEDEVVGVMKECEGAVRIKEFSKGLVGKGSRRKSVAHLSDQVESYGQQVLKEARKRSKNLDFEVANEVKASLDSLEHMEKASITAAGQRRSRRKAAVLSSTAATNEQKAGEAVGKVKQSNENVSGEDAKVSNELRRSTRNASRQSSVATGNEMNEIPDSVGKRSKNLDFEVANEVKASLDSLEHMEKASITAAGQRRSRRKADVLSSTAATNEKKAGEAVGKVKQSNENVSGEDARVSNELRRSTRNASRQSSVATVNEMNEIADSVGKVGQLKRKREAVHKTGASLDGSLVAEPPRRSTVEALKSGLVGICKSVEEKATEHIQNANYINISPLSEDTGLTMPEAAFKNFEKREESKSKTRGKRSIATVDVSALHSDTGEEMDTATNLVEASISALHSDIGEEMDTTTNLKESSISALHSDIGEEMDTATNLEVNLASTALTLASAATEEDTGLTIPEAAFENFEKRGESKSKTRGKRNVATVDVSALHSDIGEEMDTATNLEKNLASTPLKLASAATEEEASNENVSGKDAKVSNKLQSSTTNASRQSLVATFNEMNEIADSVVKDGQLKRKREALKEKEASLDGSFVGEPPRLSSLEALESSLVGLSAPCKSVDEKATEHFKNANYITISPLREYTGLTMPGAAFESFEKRGESKSKTGGKRSIATVDVLALRSEIAEEIHTATNLEKNLASTPLMMASAATEEASNENVSRKEAKVSNELQRSTMNASRQSLVATFNEMNEIADSVGKVGQLKQKREAVEETEAFLDGSLVGEFPRKSTLEASKSGLVGLSPPCKSVEEKATEHIKNANYITISPLRDDTGLTVAEAAFKRFEKREESKSKTRGKRSIATVDVKALHSDPGEEMDIATNLEENLASTPLMLASAATEEASKIVGKPEVINDDNIVRVVDIGKFVSDTKGGVEDQSHQSPEIWANLVNNNSDELKLAKFQAEACDVASPSVGFSSANQSAFEVESSNISILEKVIIRVEMSTGKDECYGSDGICDNSVEVDRISIQEDGVCGLEGTEQDDIKYGIEHNLVPDNGRSLPEVSTEIVTESTKNVCQESNKTVSTNSNFEDRKNVLDRMVPDGLPQFYFANLEDGNISNTAMAKNSSDEVLCEQIFGDCMAGKEEASFDSNGGKSFSLEAPSASEIQELPSKKLHHYEETVVESNNGVDVVTDVPITKYCNAVMNMEDSQNMDGEPEPDGTPEPNGEQHAKKSKDSGYCVEVEPGDYGGCQKVAAKVHSGADSSSSRTIREESSDSQIAVKEVVSGKFVEEQLNAAQRDQVAREGTLEDAWVVKLSNNGGSEEGPTQVNDSSDESLTESTCRESEFSEGKNVESMSQFPERIKRINGMEEKEITCEVSDAKVDSIVKFIGYHMDEEAADVHDVIRENDEATANKTCTMTIEMKEARSGGFSKKNSIVEPGKAILDREDELSKVNDAGPVAFSAVASTDFGGLDKTSDGATVRAIELENLEEKSGSELDMSDFIALGMDVKAAEANEKFENVDGNLKGKDFKNHAEKESDNIVFSSHEIASLKIQVESAMFTNWEVNLIQGNGEEDQVIISDEDLLDNSMSKDSGHVMHAEEDKVEKLEEVLEHSLVSEDSGHTVQIKDVTDIQKLGQVAEMQFNEALHSVTKEPIVDHGQYEVSAINQEFIDIQNYEDRRVENFFFSSQEDVWVEADNVDGKDDLIKCNAKCAPENNISYCSFQGIIENRACAEDKEVCAPTTGKIDILKEVADGETALSVSSDEESHEMARTKLQTIVSNCSNCEDNRPAEILLFADTYSGKPEIASGCSFTQQNEIAKASSEEFEEKVKENDDIIIGENGKAQKARGDLSDPTDVSSQGNGASCCQEVAEEQINVHQDAVNELALMDDVDYLTLNKLSCENESKIHSSEAGEAHCLQKLDDEVLTVVEPKNKDDFENLDTLSPFKSELLIDCSTISAVCSSPYHESEALEMKSEGTEESKMQDNMPTKTDDAQGSIVCEFKENESVNVEHFHVLSQTETLVENSEANTFQDAASLELTLKCEPSNLKQDNIGNLIVEDVGEAKESTKDIPKIVEEIVDHSPGFTTSGVGQGV
ncbi:uncharacterized protein LOC110665366 isoform X2 [Hevea brasiliensis]|uniref:uncharacterized protein LOC110665366 isoform X2 n=1 Tax=Hevea brasiliensis TaxID=3981 RepID=UPI0025DF201B|nr:uncharacterized protein LOC110665366 isoform X2 [Hevea brasiliensis]